VTLPEEIVSTYNRFLEAAQSASRRGSTAEDLTHGHPLMADGAARAIQEMFPALADQYRFQIVDVLRNSDDEAQRAMAAYVLVYVRRKSDIVNDLQFGLKDADAGVRNNAARSLVALSVLAKLDPSSEIRISPTWFIEMLNSLSWSDRNRALWALQTLTDSRDPLVLDQLRTRALDALIDMARWKTLSHALPAFILLGRVAGIPEPEIQAAWTRGDRDVVIAAAKKKAK
jgi:HEAT repeat protein